MTPSAKKTTTRKSAATRKSAGRKKSRRKSAGSGPSRVTVSVILVAVLVVLVGGIGLLKWSRSRSGQAALLSLGSEKMFAEVQTALGMALAEALPGFRPGPVTAGAGDAGSDDPTALDWPAEQFGPGAHVRCRQVPVAAERSYWEIQQDIAAAVGAVGGRVLWAERLLPEHLSDDQLVPSEERDLLRLDLGVRGKPTHTLVLYRAGRKPDLRWAWGAQRSAWLELLGGADQPTVALIVDDWGHNRTATTGAILDLPVPLTLAVLPGQPYSRHFALQGTDLILPPDAVGAGDGGEGIGESDDARQARLAAGCLVAVDVAGLSGRERTRRREIMLHLPMEPQGYPEIDPGPRAIMVGMAEDEIAALVDQALQALPQVTGVNNHMGSAATSDSATMAALMNVLHDRGLFFIDSLTTARSVAYTAARDAQVTAGKNRIFLDYENENADRITANLDRLVAAARATGTVVGICHPHPATAAVLTRRIPELQAQGVRFVTVSELLALRGTTAGS